MTTAKLKALYPQIEKRWDQDIVPVLMEYIKIPNKSPHFDSDWQKHGYMKQAMSLIKKWCEEQPVKNMQINLLEEPGRTPLLFIEIAGNADKTILLYGHMDKQPEMSGWREDLAPWKPVLENEKLYGRGGADDGYAIFCALTAIHAVQTANLNHHRIIILIEACEESGSPDLPFYINKLSREIGNVDVVICLDSEAGNYNQLWGTTSLRGIIGGFLTIETLTEGVHSGLGGGIVPSVFSIFHQLIDRIEDSTTGKIILNELYSPIPTGRADEAELTAKILGSEYFNNFPAIRGLKTLSSNQTELILNRTWRPTLSIVGISGVPPIQNGGNVTLPKLEVKLSFRTPPTLDTATAAKKVKEILETHPPFDAKISFEVTEQNNGWDAPPLPTWLRESINAASETFFGLPAAYTGCGGTIPFMAMLGETFPKAQFLITGVLGPQSNAHGPNEFLHIPTAKKLTGCVAAVIAAMSGR